MIEFNINQAVKVKLNKNGLKELKRQHEEIRKNYPSLHEYREPKIDEDGFTRFQMHDLMQRLGFMCQLGFEPPFHPDIILVEQGEQS